MDGNQNITSVVAYTPRQQAERIVSKSIKKCGIVIGGFSVMGGTLKWSSTTIDDNVGAEINWTQYGIGILGPLVLLSVAHDFRKRMVKWQNISPEQREEIANQQYQFLLQAELLNTQTRELSADDNARLQEEAHAAVNDYIAAKIEFNKRGAIYTTLLAAIPLIGAIFNDDIEKTFDFNADYKMHIDGQELSETLDLISYLCFGVAAVTIIGTVGAISYKEQLISNQVRRIERLRDQTAEAEVEDPEIEMAQISSIVGRTNDTNHRNIAVATPI